MNSRLSQRQQVTEAWNAAAVPWEAKIGNDGDELRRWVLAPLLARWIPRGEARVAVDVGCGNGYLLSQLGLRGWEPRGIDVSPEQVRNAERRSPEGSVFVADILSTQLEGLSNVGLVVCNMTLDGVPDLNSALQACCSLLRSHGVLIVTVPHPCFNLDIQEWDNNRNEPYQVEFATYFKLFGVEPPVPYWRRPLETYVNAVIQAGFVIQEIAEPADPPEYIEFLIRRKGDAADAHRRKGRAKTRPASILGILATR